MIMVSLGWASAFAFPGDNGTFCLLAVISAMDPLRRELATEVKGFSRSFTAADPGDRSVAGRRRGHSHIATMARVDNRYRRLVDDAGPIVSGFVMPATRPCTPIASPAGACPLPPPIPGSRCWPSKARAAPAKLTTGFDAWTAINMAAWYQLQAGADASMVRRMEAAVRGETLPPPERMEQIRSVIIELSKQPGHAGVQLRRLRHLVALPSEVLGDPIVLTAADEFPPPCVS